MAQERGPASVDLYWLPLGAGGRVVRWCGRLYESWAAWREHRDRAALFHAGLMLRLDDTAFAVEMGPVWNVTEPDRGVLLEGPVGTRWLGRFRAFRYEVRCWPGGHIPDLAEAVASPVRTTHEPGTVAAVLDVLPQLPPLTWGRDELGAGEMWNSNSAVAWALACTGHDMDALRPPPGGRAPGWSAGLVLAGRHGWDPGHHGAGAALTSRASRGESIRSSPARRRGPAGVARRGGRPRRTSRRAR
ncbi:hypothetical protein GCM10023258_36580 [Terrabacter aeriphilus]|uniref:Uncharacterized protein n=1 Tax=Terrabacter aeriphilus TaxID=515662 RepID=A0ABP9JL71_9MICO